MARRFLGLVLLVSTACVDSDTSDTGTAHDSESSTGLPGTGSPTGTGGQHGGSSEGVSGSVSTGADTLGTGTSTGATRGEEGPSGSSTAGEGSGSSSGEFVGCGDGVVDLDEECDDGDADDGNGCDNDCTESVVVGLSAGLRHTCATLDTGVVRCWGANDAGALGLGTVDAVGDDEAPADVAAAGVGIGVATVAAGSDFTCGLGADDTVRCWGRNNRGQLGYGDILDVGDDELPSTVGDNSLPAGAVVAVAAGFQHACAAFDDGEVACWGDSDFGALGYGNYDTIGDDELVTAAGFVDVPGDVVELAAGERHTCARLSTGAVRCWGYGSEGALGYGLPDWIGDTEDPSSVGEVNVPSADAIVAGGDHTCILTADTGQVWCWGTVPGGGLGYLSSDVIGDDETPVGAVMVAEDMIGETVTQVVAGSNHTCALISAGSVRCWGHGGEGQLGYGNTETVGDDETPYSAGNVDVGGPVALLAAGAAHTCALMVSGAVRCWGQGADGRLGYSNTTTIGDDETPSSAGDVPLFPDL
ncbi:MAG: RCC1 domain-containing protein [Nannocystales bacterium]